MAKALRLISDYNNARDLLAELLAEQPDSAEFNYLMGDTLIELQEAEQAVPYLEKAVQGESGIRDIRSAMARAYMQSGAPEKAIPHLQSVLEGDDDGNFHYLLA